MSQDKILLVTQDPQLGKFLSDGILRPGGFQVTQVDDKADVLSILSTSSFSLLMVEETRSHQVLFSGLEKILERLPALGVIVLSHHPLDVAKLQSALHTGVSEYLELPLKPSEIVKAVRHCLNRSGEINRWVAQKTIKHTDTLRQKVDNLQELEKIGQSVTASLDLDHILKVIVEAAVTLSGAEEGSLLILDELSGELFMRASKNFKDDFVRTFRLPVNDTLAGQVVRTGQPILLNEDTPQKIKTTYLVRSLMYVPIKSHGKILGVLGVDHREQGPSFTRRHLMLASTLADYAAIAIENARLYKNTDVERYKLETILAQIEDGVIVVDTDGQVMLINRMARNLFNLGSDEIISKPFNQVFSDEAFLDFLKTPTDRDRYKAELELANGTTLNIQRVNIPQVGVAVTVQDVTKFIELDRIKSDFVNTVSHDLRSPLTAILGYVELIGRVGDVNERQKEFIERVQISVRNITELINDLLDLGRIEAGFDTRKDLIPLDVIVDYAIESVKTRIDQKQIHLERNYTDGLPKILGDSVRLRQVVDNLLSNAVRYTPEGGRIRIQMRSANDQLILEVEDTGIGIPIADQPFIFDKFYRASNVPIDNSGSGLGLAIVKSIVDSHNGRIWVNSQAGKGACFTVVMPVFVES